MRIASLLSIFSSASAPAVQGKSFDSALQAAISDALQRHSSQGSADNDAQSMTPANASGTATDSKADEASVATPDTAVVSDAADPGATNSTAEIAPASTVFAVTQQGGAPATTIDAQVAARTSSARVWSQTATATGAQIEATRVKRTTGGGAVRTVSPATKFTGTVQTAMTAPFLRPAAVSAAQNEPAASTPQPPIASVTPLPVAEAAVPASVPGPELHGTPSLIPGVSPEMSFAVSAGGDSFAPQTLSSPGNDVATSGNDGRQDADSAMAATTAQTAQPAAKISATSVSNAGVSNAGHSAPAATVTAQSSAAAPVAAALTDVQAARVTPANAAAQAGAASGVQVPAEFLNVFMDVSAVAADLPAAPALSGGLPQTFVTPTQRGAPRATGSGNADVNATGGTPRTRTAEGAGGMSDDFALGIQNTVQPVQRSHADASQAAVAAPATANAQVAQAMVVPAHANAQDADPVARAMDSAPDASRESLPRGDSALLPQGVDDAAPASGIHAASVIRAMGGTEMRLGMNSTEFGEISIRTSVSAQQMQTQIAVDHSGLGQAISAHASSVQARFQEQYGVHSAIEVTQQGAPFSGGQGGSAQREQQGFVRSARSETAATPDETEIGPGQLAIAGAGNEYRLDIRA